MWIVGVTGGIGSGKSAVTQRFESHGIHVVDADIVAREVVAPGEPALQAIVDHFGPKVILPDGQLDRRALRARVFEAPAERRWLEQLTHPLIRERLLAQLAASPSPYSILVAPLLLEGTLHSAVNRILVVDAPESQQIARTVARDNTDAASVQAVLDAQLSRAERCARADDIIVNDSDLQHLDDAVDALHQRYLQLSQASEHTQTERT